METEAEVLKTATKVAEVAALQADICTDTAIRLLIALLLTRKGCMRQRSLVIQEQHEANMRLHHEYYSRIEGGHGVRDIVEAHTKPKVQLRLTLID